MNKRWMAVIAIWIALALGGLGYLLVYDFTPGQDKGTPSLWPKSAAVARDAKLPTLIMFAHPHCPCTRASIEELAVLMAHSQGKVAAHVLFTRPKGTTENWTQTDLWRSAAAIPGVAVQVDDDASIARQFGAATSGRVVLYDADGNLLFHGGITDGRGHAGDNAGLTSILAMLHGAKSDITSTSTFGCSLVNLPPN